MVTWEQGQRHGGEDHDEEHASEKDHSCHENPIQIHVDELLREPVGDVVSVFESKRKHIGHDGNRSEHDAFREPPARAEREGPHARAPRLLGLAGLPHLPLKYPHFAARNPRSLTSAMGSTAALRLVVTRGTPVRGMLSWGPIAKMKSRRAN